MTGSLKERNMYEEHGGEDYGVVARVVEALMLSMRG